MNRTRTDQSEKDEVERICKSHKGNFTRFSDGSYKCSGVMDATIDFDMGKISLNQTGSPSRLKIEGEKP